MGPRRCILHIGICKTGTTSIQHALATNRELLAQKGIVIPKTYGHTQNHRHITLLGLDSESIDAKREWEILRERLPGHAPCRSMVEGQQWVERELQSELEGYTDDQWVIFSSEQMSQRLQRDCELLKLRHALERLGFSTIRIALYLREQVGLAMSWESMEALAGRASPPLLGTETIFDHELLVKRWERVWGRERLVIRTYAKSALVGEDVVRDFATQILPVTGDISWLKSEEKRNVRLGARSIFLLRCANRILPGLLPKTTVASCRSIVFSLSRLKWINGKPMQASQARINQQADCFRRSNRWVDRNYGTHLEESFGST